MADLPVIHFLAANHSIGGRWYTFSTQRTEIHDYAWSHGAWIDVHDSVSKYYPCAAVLRDTEGRCCCVFTALQGSDRHSHGAAVHDTLIVESEAPTLSSIQLDLLRAFLARANAQASPLSPLSLALEDHGLEGVRLDPVRFTQELRTLAADAEFGSHASSTSRLERGLWRDTPRARRSLYARLRDLNTEEPREMSARFIAIVTTDRHVSVPALQSSSWLYVLTDGPAPAAVALPSAPADDPALFPQRDALPAMAVGAVIVEPAPPPEVPEPAQQDRDVCVDAPFIANHDETTLRVPTGADQQTDRGYQQFRAGAIGFALAAAVAFTVWRLLR